MRINGITFVGSRTDARPAMAAFLRDVLGLATAAPAEGMDADVFQLPDGSSFAVAPGVPPEEDDRTIGFSVDDIDAARARLVGAGVWVDPEVSVNERFRYLHFRAPDGHLYELVEERSTAGEGDPPPWRRLARRRNRGNARADGGSGWARRAGVVPLRAPRSSCCGPRRGC